MGFSLYIYRIMAEKNETLYAYGFQNIDREGGKVLAMSRMEG